MAGRNPETFDAATVAQRLLPALAVASARGFRYFPPWFEDFTRHVWRYPQHMACMAIPVKSRGKLDRASWSSFRGGSTQLAGDPWPMFKYYRHVLLDEGVLETLTSPDGASRKCGEWAVNLPVPEGLHGPGEAWRVAREMAQEMGLNCPILMSAVKEHVQRAVPHLLPKPRGSRAMFARSEHSPRNRHHLDQLRLGVVLGAMRANPRCMPVVKWPNGDRVDDADVAVFARWGDKSPVAVVKCALGLPDDPEVEAMAGLVEAHAAEHEDTAFLYITLWDPDPAVVAKLSSEVRVLSVLTKRAPSPAPTD